MAHEGKKTVQARFLKTNMTAAERRLWARLRGGRFEGLVFNRQQPIGPYIADFYCSIARVAVEIDGAGHDWKRVADERRDRWMADEGVLVLRFANHQVMNDLATVLAEILSACKGAFPKSDQGT